MSKSQKSSKLNYACSWTEGTSKGTRSLLDFTATGGDLETLEDPYKNLTGTSLVGLLLFNLTTSVQLIKKIQLNKQFYFGSDSLG